MSSMGCRRIEQEVELIEDLSRPGLRILRARAHHYRSVSACCTRATGPRGSQAVDAGCHTEIGDVVVPISRYTKR